jgi:1,4-dihydroxy-2-naphthoate octaprenyltransferase
VQVIRVWIEGFLRGRYGYEGDQVYWALAVLVLVGAILAPVLLLAGPLLWIAALVLVLLLLRIEQPVKAKQKDRGLSASSMMALAVAALIVAACWAASIGIFLLYVAHTE